MACSRFEYVRNFEQYPTLLPGCWAVIRLDGRGFTKFASLHSFAKPNDARALHLMNSAAAAVMEAFRDVVCAFGESDEFSFVCRRDCRLFGRRERCAREIVLFRIMHTGALKRRILTVCSKILSAVVSLFTAAYVMRWREFMGDSTPLLTPVSGSFCFARIKARRDTGTEDMLTDFGL